MCEGTRTETNVCLIDVYRVECMEAINSGCDERKDIGSRAPPKVGGQDEAGFRGGLFTSPLIWGGHVLAQQMFK